MNRKNAAYLKSNTFRGLVGEVVSDCYHLHNVKFHPDVVFDIGANVGVFSRFARMWFPLARIVALEPHPENTAMFRHLNHDPNLTLVEGALGCGPVYMAKGAANGSGASYLTPGLGFPESGLQNTDSFVPAEVQSVALHDLVMGHKGDGTSLIKVDCEGGENSIFGDANSLRALLTFDFICFELHSYATTGELVEKVRDRTERGLAMLGETHKCHRDGIYFWAHRKADKWNT